VGDNGNGPGNGFSYIIGYNKRYPKAPHHRTASCGQDGCLCTTEPSAFTVYGALVGAWAGLVGWLVGCCDGGLDGPDCVRFLLVLFFCLFVCLCVVC
jgi:hypothetical protein